jgi:hypothetical protein
MPRVLRVLLIYGICTPCNITNSKNCKILNDELYCIECIDGQRLIDVRESPCILECPNSYYTDYNKEGSKKCSKCIDNCKLCPGYEECISCI